MKKLFAVLLVFTSVLFSQWTEVQLLPFEGTFSGFYMSDSLHITAVYYHNTGFVVKSSDGGRNWTIKHDIPITDISNVSFIDDNNIFIASSTPSTFLKTTDGGATWTAITIPDRFSSLLQIQFFDQNFGYALTSYASGNFTYQMIIKTENGGQSWVMLDSTIKTIRNISFKDRQLGWVFGSSVYKTTNGGATFSSQFIPFGFSNPTSIDILNDTMMILGGGRLVQPSPWEIYYEPMIAGSTDSGTNWNQIHIFAQQNFRGIVNNIHFIDENRAFGTLHTGGIMYTTNKGLSWDRGLYPQRAYQYSDAKVFNNRIYGSGPGSLFLASGEDISLPWEVRLNHLPSPPLSAAFHDPGYAIISTQPIYQQSAKLLISTDRGENWVVKPSMGGNVLDIEISHDSLVYSVTANSIYKSDLKCENFTLISSFSGVQLKDMQVLSNGDLWVCANKNLMLSTDHGVNWTIKLAVTTENFVKIQFLPDGTGYASNGELYKSTDYGENWSKLGFQSASISDFQFYDSNNGLVAGFNSQVYRTRDGGVNFELVNIPGMYGARNVYCKDSLNFFVGANKLHSTYDGGWSWKVNEFSEIYTSKYFTRMHMFDHFEGLFVSSTLDVWRTWNRGNTPVELSLFSALPFGNKVVLQWTTETETNNMGFEIERKYKYGDWKKIAFSKGSGTSTRKIFYGYDDYELKAPAILYYRLKQIDYNGEFEYSNEVEVLLGEVPENYSIQQNYPNPFNPSTKVTFSLPEENKVVIRVFNAMGEQVREIERGILSHGYFEQDFEMGTESSGMYFCQVLCTNTISGRTISLTVKMVLMK